MNREKIFSKGEFIGAYEVERVLATGGMGVIYEAKPDPAHRSDLLAMGIHKVALKMMRLEGPELSRHERKQMVARLDREFETLFRLSRLGHPNVVRVFDLGRENGVPFYVMELVDGITLDEALAEQPRWGQMMTVYAKLCGAVAFLHEGGICHRDLKPSNVLVRRDGGDPVLIDFGICLPPSQRTLTGVRDLLGTPQYLSPEYATHWFDPEVTRPYVAASTDDVWALGVILYEILTGRSPWLSPPYRREELLREIQARTPVHPCEVNPKAPQALGDLTLRLLERNCEKRPANGSEVLLLLGPAAEVSDVLGRVPAPRPAPRARKTRWRETAHPVTPRPTRRPEPEVTDASPAPSRFRPLEFAAFAALAVLMLIGLLVHDVRTHASTDRSIAQGGAAVQAMEQYVATQQRAPSVELMGSSGFHQPGPVAFTPVSMYGIEQRNWGTLFLGELPLPPGPLEGQLRPPCFNMTEINGGCWQSTWALVPGATCPPGESRYKNVCYRPVRDPRFPLPPAPKKPNADNSYHWKETAP